jgi:MATE family multidrug resistance protein
MFIISFICYWLIGLPVGVSLSLTDLLVPAMGAKGFWIGFITALSCAAVLMFWRLRIIQQRIRLNLLDAS